MSAPDLRIDLCGIKLENPLILASGIWGVTGESMKKVCGAGAAAVVTKSIGTTPRDGHSNPTLIEIPHGLLNAMGLPNPGIDEFGTEINILKECGVSVIGSIFGADSGEYGALAKKMEGLGVDGIELNLSCPHAKGLGLELGSDPDQVKDCVGAVKEAVKLPVFAKLTPHTPRIVDLGAAAMEAKADALVAVNTIRAVSIDIKTGTPVLGNKIGGYSGPALKPIGVRAVYELRSELDIPVIGVGGIMTGEDVVEYLMAGAAAVQIGSGVFYEGIEIFNKIEDELLTFMEDNGYAKISDIEGLALIK